MTYNPAEALRDDWQWVEGVVVGAFEYGPDRFTTGLPEAPDTGIRLRIGNPTKNQIAIAASTVGYRTTDQVITIWSDTLREDPPDENSQQLEPMEGDFIIVSGYRWMIKSLKQTVYETQWVCYCARGTAQAPREPNTGGAFTIDTTEVTVDTTQETVDQETFI